MRPAGSGRFSLCLATGRIVSLTPGSLLAAADLPGLHSIPPGGPVGRVTSHPHDPNISGLQNLSQLPWQVHLANGDRVSVKPGKNVRMTDGTRINFGAIYGEIKWDPGYAFGRHNSWLRPAGIAFLLAATAVGGWWVASRYAWQKVPERKRTVSATPPAAAQSSPGDTLPSTPTARQQPNNQSAITASPATVDFAHDEPKPDTIASNPPTQTTTPAARPTPIPAHIITESSLPPDNSTLLPVAKEYKLSNWEQNKYIDGAPAGFINTRGQTVISPRWDHILEFHEGIAIMDASHAVDKTGRRIITLPQGYVFLASAFCDGLARIQDSNGQLFSNWGFVDKHGRIAIPTRLGACGHFAEHVASAYDGKLKLDGFINTRGQVVIPPRWHECSPFRDGLAAVRSSYKWGFIDRSGRTVIEPQWDAAYPFGDGLAGVKRDGKWGFIDRAGRLVVDTVWDDVGDFSDGFAIVKRSNLWGCINRSGEIVYRPEYVEIAVGHKGAVFAIKDRRLYRLNGYDAPISDELFDGLYAYQENKGSPWYFEAVRVDEQTAAWFDEAGKQIWSSRSWSK